MATRRFIIELEDSLKGFEQDVDYLTMKYGAEEVKSDIVPVIVKRSFGNFNGAFDKKRMLLYFNPVTAEFAKTVGFRWEEVDNEDHSID